MKLDNILVAYTILFVYIVIVGVMIIAEAPNGTQQTGGIRWKDGVIVKIYGVDHDTFQFKLGTFLTRYSFLLALPAIYVDRLNGWWNKR